MIIRRNASDGGAARRLFPLFAEEREGYGGECQLRIFRQIFSQFVVDFFVKLNIFYLTRKRRIWERVAATDFPPNISTIFSGFALADSVWIYLQKIVCRMEKRRLWERLADRFSAKYFLFHDISLFQCCLSYKFSWFLLRRAFSDVACQKLV